MNTESRVIKNKVEAKRIQRSGCRLLSKQPARILFKEHFKRQELRVRSWTFLKLAKILYQPARYWKSQLSRHCKMTIKKNASAALSGKVALKVRVSVG